MEQIKLGGKLLKISDLVSLYEWEACMGYAPSGNKITYDPVTYISYIEIRKFMGKISKKRKNVFCRLLAFQEYQELINKKILPEEFFKKEFILMKKNIMVSYLYILENDKVHTITSRHKEHDIGFRIVEVE